MVRAVVFAAVLGVLPASASASRLLDTRVASTAPVFRACSLDPVPDGRGFVQRNVTASKLGWVTARLQARGRGDWDVAIFDRAGGNLVAGSAGFGGSEIASGVAERGQRLVVQACRLSGSARSVSLEVDETAIDTSAKPVQLSLVRVVTASQDRKRELSNLGMDLTEHGGRNFVEVVLHGDADAAKLRNHKFMYTAVVRDLVARTVKDRAADARYARRVRSSAVPSGRDTYRRLNDYGEDMKKLVRENPDLVKPITLPFKTWTGRPVEGIEITTDVSRRDGKPVFLNMGVHHAREWPSGEHAMEWAFELVNGYKNGDARTNAFVRSTRTIVIPIVNPDGFNTSREAGETAGAGGGRGGPDETPNLAIPYEYQRKNCRVNNTSGDDPEQGDCEQQPALGLSQFGVDPNRNYGGFWGGDGATANGGSPPGDYAQDYRGNGPFSEPETQNIRWLASHRQITTLITNHTFSNLVLRPPGIQRQGTPVDEPVYKALGDSMAAENGYVSQPGYQLYDTTGTTEDWSYYATGGLGFTFEIGPSNFHPPFAETVAEYEGTSDAAKAIGGHGNREAYFKAQGNTADASKHSVLAGRAPSGAVLRLKKSFQTLTSPVQDASGNAGQPISFSDTLDTVLETPTDSDSFEWHINPSTRPITAQTKGRVANGSPSPPVQRDNNPPPLPPCPAYFELGSDACPPTSFKDEEFQVPANGGGVDNGFATIEITWAAATSDFDMEIYRDVNDNGSVDAADGGPIASSAQGTTSSEKTTIGPDPAPGRYFARVVNYAAGEPYNLKVSFEGPEPFKPGSTETWGLTCESFSGTVLTNQDVLIARGERKDPGLQACTAAFNEAFATGKNCDAPTKKVYRKGLDRARLGRSRSRHLRSYKIGLKGRRGLDKFCLKDKSTVRVGYPSGKVLRKLKAKERRGLGSSKAGLILTSSKRFSVRKVRVGANAATLRTRIGRVRGLRIGRNTWYVKRGAKARLLFKMRAGKVREVGEASLKLTSSRKRAARLLKSFRLQ